MITQILLQQTIIMFALMLLGLLLSRRGMITEQGSRDLSNVLLYAVIPCVILRSYMSEFSTEKLREMGLSALIAVIAFAASIAVAYLTCGTRHRIENFAVAFGNAGFIGIPLVTAVFGPEAAFYVVSFSTFANLLQWTYGIVIISGKKETMNLRMVFVNPVFISMVIGIALFVLQPTLPTVVTGTIGYIADGNTVLAMIILGSPRCSCAVCSLMYGCISSPHCVCSSFRRSRYSCSCRSPSRAARLRSSRSSRPQRRSQAAPPSLRRSSIRTTAGQSPTSASPPFSRSQRSRSSCSLRNGCSRKFFR